VCPIAVPARSVTDVLGGHIATGITALAAVGGQVSSSAVRGQARFAREAIDTKTLDAAAFTAYFKAEAERWTPLARSVVDKVKTGEGGR
jgi:hypothetical protein